MHENGGVEAHRAKVRGPKGRERGGGILHKEAASPVSTS